MSRSEEASRGSTHPPVRRLDARIHPLTRSSIRAFGCLVVVAAVGVLAAPTSSASSVARRGGASVEALVAVGGVPTRPSGALSGRVAGGDSGHLARCRAATSRPGGARCVRQGGLDAALASLSPLPDPGGVRGRVRSLGDEHCGGRARRCGGRICASGRCRGTVSSFRSAGPSVQSTRPSTRGSSPTDFREGRRGGRRSRHPGCPAMSRRPSRPCSVSTTSSCRIRQSSGAPSAREANQARTPRPRPPASADTPGACAAASDTASASGGWTEDQLAQAYGLTGLYDEGGLGDGETIGVLELEPFLRSDIDAFDDCFFGPGHTTVIHTFPVDGFDLQGSGTGEAVLDLEMLAALVPGARSTSTRPRTRRSDRRRLNAMVSADQANIVSTSWGACETSLQVSAPGTQQIENDIFEEAAAQGQTCSRRPATRGRMTARGRSSRPRNPCRRTFRSMIPASQPYVVAVGGTSLQSDTPPLGGAAERVWNDGALGRRHRRRGVGLLAESGLAGAVRRPGHDGRDKPHGSRREFGRGREPRSHLLQRQLRVHFGFVVDRPGGELRLGDDRWDVDRRSDVGRVVADIGRRAVPAARSA